jgi:ATP-dependent RNA helicase RhlE
MNSFDQFNLKKHLKNAVDDLGFTAPTPIQEKTFSTILSGKDLVGIAQTGTGKTLAYLLPILEEMKYSKELNPRVLILVPTRELVQQVVDQAEELAKYMNVRVVGVYGGANINTQSIELSHGVDILVATPGRLYDLALARAFHVKGIKKLVIDEVDVMLDLGFRPQLTNIMEIIPAKRQNIMFSATMTDHVDIMIDDFFKSPEKISIAVSGTPLENIEQESYIVPNFYTKVNLLKYLLQDKSWFEKVLVFVGDKRSADRVFNALFAEMKEEVAVIHSNKSQNYRFRSIEDFDGGKNRILVSTDVMARGLDLEKITHVINFDTPKFPENYMHRIGRTGRAKQKGHTILFYTEAEQAYKDSIEALMSRTILLTEFPEEVEISKELTPEERPQEVEINLGAKAVKSQSGAFHEKKAKNQKVNEGGSYKKEIAKKYKKPQTRGDKTYHKKKKRG